MSESNAAGAELLEKVRRELARNQRTPTRTLYRVVEVGRDPDGRLVRHGKVWNADLDAVRRFGRALAANSVAQQVSVGDSAGATLEEIAPPPAGVEPPGWQGWRDIPLPPLPRPRPAKPRPAWLTAAAAELPRVASAPPRDLPVLGASGAAAADEPMTTLARPESPTPAAPDADDVDIVS